MTAFDRRRSFFPLGNAYRKRQLIVANFSEIPPGFSKKLRFVLFGIENSPIFVANTNTMIKINNLGLADSVFNQFMAEMRDATIQQDRLRFRRNLERIGEIMAYEISKTLDYDEEEITTPLGIKEIRTLKEQPVIATILRAGLPFHNGMLSMFDHADNAFIAAYRKYDKNEDFEIKVEYYSSPDLEDKVLILCDPMLATGESIVKTLRGLLDDMTPKHIHIAVAVASQEGLGIGKEAFFRLHLHLTFHVDTAQTVIVFGDAGDLAYGEKR